MTRNELFIKPEVSDFSPDPNTPHWGPYLTYSHYNFLRKGMIAKLNCRRLVAALQLAEFYFGKTGAMDVGCADGILLPSLSRHFPHVSAVDSHDASLKHARSLVSNLKLNNVEVILNQSESTEQLRSQLGSRKHGLMFLLETLEHIGKSPATMYDDKLAFLDEMFTLLEPGGAIVVSVPKTVGPALLAKYMIQAVRRLPKQNAPWPALIRAGLFYDSSKLEPMWNNGHLGFNQLTLERRLRERFEIVRRRKLTGTMLWLIKRRGEAGDSASK